MLTTESKSVAYIQSRGTDSEIDFQAVETYLTPRHWDVTNGEIRDAVTPDELGIAPSAIYHLDKEALDWVINPNTNEAALIVYRPEEVATAQHLLEE